MELLVRDQRWCGRLPSDLGAYTTGRTPFPVAVIRRAARARRAIAGILREPLGSGLLRGVVDLVVFAKRAEAPHGARATRPSRVLGAASEREVVPRAQLVATEIVQLFQVEVPRFVA